MKSANPEHWDFYRRFRQKMCSLAQSPNRKQSNRVMEILMVGPDLLHLSLRLMTDPSVSTKHKMILGSAVAYFISPIDLIPEALLGPFGYLDDIVILTFVLNHLLNDIPEELVERYWAGDTDLLNVLRGVIMGADRILGKGMIQRLRNHLKITE